MVSKFRKYGVLFAFLCTLPIAPLALADDDDDDDDQEQIEIEIDKAQYKKKRHQLKVKGEVDDADGKVEVEVWAADLEILLASKRTREDFKFTIDLDPEIPVPCVIEVRASGETAAKRVKKAPKDCGQYKTTLTGLVTDGPVPFATVTVTVNGQSFTTVADANGAYSLDILSASLDELVTIEATATNEQTGDPINFVSLAGTFSKTIEEPDNNVTNVTTAKYTLVVEANDGVVPTTLDELQSAETAVDASALIELASVIKLIVDDPRFTLPEGFDNLIDFVQDQQSVDAFVEEVAVVDDTALANATAEILADSELVAGFTADEIPSQYYAVPTVNPGFLSRSGDVLEFDPSGSGNILSYQENSGQAVNTAFTWVIDGGRLELIYNNPTQLQVGTFEISDLTENQAEIDAYFAGGGIEGGFIPYLLTTVSEAYTRLDDGALVDVVSKEFRNVISVPPFQLQDGSTLTIAEDRLVIGSSNETLRSSIDVIRTPFTTTCGTDEVCVYGAWGGLFHYVPGRRFSFQGGELYPNNAYGDVLTINPDGTVTGVVSGVVASWSLDAQGRLEISYSDGFSQTTELVDNLGLEYGAVTFFESGSERFATYSIWTRGDASLVLTDQDVVSEPGKYWNGEVNTYIPGSFDENGIRIPQRRFGWEFFDDGSLNNLSSDDRTDNDGDGNPDVGLLIQPTQGWGLDSNRVRIERFSFATRFWYPINVTVVDGQRVFYVMEVEIRNESLWFGGEPGEKLLFPARINIQRELDQFNDWDYTRILDPR